MQCKASTCDTIVGSRTRAVRSRTLPRFFPVAAGGALRGAGSPDALMELAPGPQRESVRYLSADADTAAFDYCGGASGEQPTLILKRDWLHKHTHVVADPPSRPVFFHTAPLSWTPILGIPTITIVPYHTTSIKVVGFAAVRPLSRRQALGVLCARCCVELHARGRLAALPARPR